MCIRDSIWIALQIATRREKGDKGLWGLWLALIISSALALVSKYTGTIFVAGAFGGIFIAEVIRTFRKQNLISNLISSTTKLVVSGLLALVLVVALSPALWNDPISRVRDLSQMLQD